jgi:hypothetical protein
MQKMMYLLVSQHVSGIIMPIIRGMVQNQQRLWCTALTVLQKTRGEEVVSPFPTSAHEPPLLHESTATQPVLYTTGAVDFVPFS